MARDLVRRLRAATAVIERRHLWRRPDPATSGHLEIGSLRCARRDCRWVWSADVPVEPVGCRGHVEPPPDVVVLTSLPGERPNSRNVR